MSATVGGLSTGAGAGSWGLVSTGRWTATADGCGIATCCWVTAFDVVGVCCATVVVGGGDTAGDCARVFTVCWEVRAATFWGATFGAIVFGGGDTTRVLRVCTLAGGCGVVRGSGNAVEGAAASASVNLPAGAASFWAVGDGSGETGGVCCAQRAGGGRG